MDYGEKKYQALQQYFGYSQFREGQQPIIDQILSGRDVLGVMPTGAGKSLCYQLPALLFPGITLVISPLISLMKDQVESLVQSGVRAAFINSSLSLSQYGRALDNARQGQYKIIYVAPERLVTPGFLEFAQSAPISMVTVDEAHCVSQWGQDFRPGYLKIPQFIGELPRRPVVSAFTATATSQVREDILRLLELEQPFTLTTGFDRKNLFFQVEKPKDKYAAAKRFLRSHYGESGIVYCATRKTVEEMCQRLSAEGFSVSRYHAGLSDRERRQNQEDFLYDRVAVMVATNAFGMGIDKSNVSFVLHYNMPKNLESYYQEAGRAGRDGSEAVCLLLYGGQDVITNQFLIENASGENEELDPITREEVQAKERERLRRMTYYCHTQDCLRQYILSYFGEQSTNWCGHCGNCQGEAESQDVTRQAQMILSCVKRMGERYGIQTVIQTLRGSKEEKILRLGLNRLSTYGLMAGEPAADIREMVNFLVVGGWLRVTDDKYPVVKLTQQSGEVLYGGKQLSMKRHRHHEPERREEEEGRRPGSGERLGRGGRLRSAGAAGSSPEGQAAERPELFEQLKGLRNRLASEQRVPAYIVFADVTLREMCRLLPRDREALREITGVGQVKLERYGDAFLEEISRFLQGETVPD